MDTNANIVRYNTNTNTKRGKEETKHVKPLERQVNHLPFFIDLWICQLCTTLYHYIFKRYSECKDGKGTTVHSWGEHVKPLSCHPAKTQSQHRAHPLNDHHEHSPNDDDNDDDVEDV